MIPTNLSLRVGDLFDTAAAVIGQGANTTVPTSGNSGLARIFAELFPTWSVHYDALTSTGRIIPGEHDLWEEPDGTRIASLAIQRLGGADARRVWLEASLDALLADMEARKLTSLALPALGAGIGGLDMLDTLNGIRDAADRHPSISIEIVLLPDEPGRLRARNWFQSYRNRPMFEQMRQLHLDGKPQLVNDPKGEMIGRLIGGETIDLSKTKFSAADEGFDPLARASLGRKAAEIIGADDPAAAQQAPLDFDESAPAIAIDESWIVDKGDPEELRKLGRWARGRVLDSDEELSAAAMQHLTDTYGHKSPLSPELRDSLRAVLGVDPKPASTPPVGLMPSLVQAVFGGADAQGRYFLIWPGTNSDDAIAAVLRAFLDAVQEREQLVADHGVADLAELSPDINPGPVKLRIIKRAFDAPLSDETQALYDQAIAVPARFGAIIQHPDA